MPTGGYQIRDQLAIHFITFSVAEWVDVFIRKEYADIVLVSLRYCQGHREGKQEELDVVDLQECRAKEPTERKVPVLATDNHHIECFSPEVLESKMKYLHENHCVRES